MDNYNPHCPTCMSRKEENKAAQAVLNSWEYSFWLSVKDNVQLSAKQMSKYQKIREKLDLAGELTRAKSQVQALTMRLSELKDRS